MVNNKSILSSRGADFFQLTRDPVGFKNWGYPKPDSPKTSKKTEKIEKSKKYLLFSPEFMGFAAFELSDFRATQVSGFGIFW